jgi:hypothetical protein
MLWATVSLVGATLPACRQQDTATARGGGRRPDLYIQISALGSLEYFYDHRLGMKQAGELLGVKTEYRGPTDLDIGAMVADLELWTPICRAPGVSRSSARAITTRATRAG